MQSLRASAGFPACAMHDPPAVHWNFTTDADATFARTALSDEFWAAFPCSREQYRVVLPDGVRDGTEVGALAPRNYTDDGGDDTCAATITTALFDIGRERWVTLARPSAEYLQRMHTVASLRNPMVVYTGTEFVDRVAAMRREFGTMHRTLIIGMDLHCTPAAHWYKPAKRIMCKPEYTRGAAHALTPERLEPWYNILMWNKAFFMSATAAAAAALRAVDSPYHIWLDAGCHEPMCSPSMARACLLPKPWARRDRVRIAQTALLAPDVAALTPVEYYKRKFVHFAGTVFGTSRANVRAAMALFIDTLAWMNAQGAVEQDQAVFAYAFIRRPDAFDAYFVDGEWVLIVQDF